MIKLGLVTYNLASNWDLNTIFKRSEIHGIEAVEFRTTHAHEIEIGLNSQERSQLRDKFANSMIKQISLGSTCEYHSTNPDEVSSNINETKDYIKLAQDIGGIGVKVRPNGFKEDEGISKDATLEQIGISLRECGEAAEGTNVSVWLEVHGIEIDYPPYIAKIMNIANHPKVGICWNSNPADIVQGSVEKYFDLLRPWLMSVHINNIWNPEYPYREFFSLLKNSGYDGYCLAEIQDGSKEPDTFLRYYKALFQELSE